MRFVQQLPAIKLTNFDDRLRPIIGDNAEKPRKHGTMLPSTIRAIVDWFAATRIVGKTNVLISLLESPHGVRFENVYVYSKSLQ